MDSNEDWEWLKKRNYSAEAELKNHQILSNSGEIWRILKIFITFLKDIFF
jgi:hypothetical protein